MSSISQDPATPHWAVVAVKRLLENIAFFGPDNTSKHHSLIYSDSLRWQYHSNTLTVFNSLNLPSLWNKIAFNVETSYQGFYRRLNSGRICFNCPKLFLYNMESFTSASLKWLVTGRLVTLTLGRAKWDNTV